MTELTGTADADSLAEFLQASTIQPNSLSAHAEVHFAIFETAPRTN